MQKGLYTSRLMISQRLQELKKDNEKVQEINNKYLKLEQIDIINIDEYLVK